MLLDSRQHLEELLGIARTSLWCWIIRMTLLLFKCFTCSDSNLLLRFLLTLSFGYVNMAIKLQPSLITLKFILQQYLEFLSLPFCLCKSDLLSLILVEFTRQIYELIASESGPHPSTTRDWRGIQMDQGLFKQLGRHYDQK